MSKKMKLNLEELKVQSFITTTHSSFLRTIIGGLTEEPHDSRNRCVTIIDYCGSITGDRSECRQSADQIACEYEP